MRTSKHAPKTPRESLEQSQADRLKQQKQTAARLLIRLQWKAELLVASYFRAVQMLQSDGNSNDLLGQGQHAFALGITSKQAESMFKVDFFEFYTLMERYITVALAVVGIHVSAGIGPRSNVNALRFITNPEFSRRRPEASHAFHANLLEALEDDKCPLRDSLGSQECQIQLRMAKDYRNAWKDADETKTTSYTMSEDGERRRNTRLVDLDLETMLRTLLIGCEHTQNVVQGRTPPKLEDGGISSRDFEPQAQHYEIMEMDDIPIEYMDDAMDLD